MAVISTHNSSELAPVATADVLSLTCYLLRDAHIWREVM
jgi:hypothetical protein